MPWTEPTDFRETLAATIAKSQEDRRIFELLFDRFFFRAAEAEALEQGIREDRRYEGGERLDLDELREAIRAAIAEGSDGEMRDAARLAIAAFGRQGEGSGVVGVDVQRIRRTLGLQAGNRDADGDGIELDREQIQAFERHLRRELERALIERTEKMPPSRPLAELDRALPTSPTQDLAAVHRAVAQLKRRLATLGHEQRGRKRASHVDMRRTMRASLETGGVPLRLKYRPKRPRRPEIYVLCDVSTSVTSASVFFSSPSCTRSTTRFASCAASSSSSASPRSPRCSTASATSARSPRRSARRAGSPTSPATPTTGCLARVLRRDLRGPGPAIDRDRARRRAHERPRAARRDLRPDLRTAGRTFWLNPEPRLYWNYGDSVMSAYERHCDRAFECWTTKHLENFVNVIAGGQPVEAD